MSEHEYECAKCGPVYSGIQWRGGNSLDHLVYGQPNRDCGPVRWLGKPASSFSGGRDQLLAEISRSLRATHPDSAEELIRACEKAMPTPHAGPFITMTPKQANAVLRLQGLPKGTLISVPLPSYL